MHIYIWTGENDIVFSSSPTATVSKVVIYKAVVISIDGCISDIQEITINVSFIAIIKMDDNEIVDDSETIVLPDILLV